MFVLIGLVQEYTVVVMFYYVHNTYKNDDCKICKMFIQLFLFLNSPQQSIGFSLFMPFFSDFWGVIIIGAYIIKWLGHLLKIVLYLFNKKVPIYNSY